MDGSKDILQTADETGSAGMMDILTVKFSPILTTCSCGSIAIVFKSSPFTYNATIDKRKIATAIPTFTLISIPKNVISNSI